MQQRVILLFINCSEHVEEQVINNKITNCCIKLVSHLFTFFSKLRACNYYIISVGTLIIALLCESDII